MIDLLKQIAPTVATALLGPLGGAAVTAIGDILGIDKATQQDLDDAFRGRQLLPEHVAKLRELELQYQADELERGFRYAELAFKDRADARKVALDGGMLNHLFWLSVGLLVLTIGSEITVLFVGYPPELPEIVVGRVLGLLDGITLLVLGFWFSTSLGSSLKTGLITKAAESGTTK